MGAENHPTAATNGDWDERLSLEQKQILQSAVAKIVSYGESVGVSANQIAELLSSGFTVRELLDYLAARTTEVA
jgi:hypothetical protein